MCFVLIYGGADYLTGLHDYRVRFHLSIELGIPFVPCMVVFYNSLHVWYSVTPFILRTRRELNAMAAVLISITVFGGLVFLLLPAEDAYPTPPDEALGVWKTMFRFADCANLRYNSCPSLHVAWAIVCVDLFASCAKVIGKTVIWAFGIGLMFSAVLIHQHHVVEVVAGFVLALSATRLLYPRLRDGQLLASRPHIERGAVGSDSDPPAGK